MQPIPYILATAGHVDHGKSAVVRTLTGIDPDRLPEEKARGITIDLGFAHLMLDSGAAKYRVGIVDVPGHEDFVKNMVAGVGSIDIALLIVAADDGWMPQTEEHLQILTYLGVSHGVIALTKIDLAEGRENVVIEAIRERLRDTPLTNAPIVPTSIVSGRGFDELKRAIASVLATTPPQRDIGKPRLPVDRAFSLKGVGTVVTGTLTGGALRRGQSAIVQPYEVTTRLRSVQSHNTDVEIAQPGSRVALNLVDVEVRNDQTSPGQRVVGRGDVVTIADLGTPNDVLDVLLERSSRAATRTMKDGARVQVHHGSAAIPARVQLLDQSELKPGQRGVARLRFERPLLALVGDRFIVRDWPEQHTRAGGIVLDAHPTRSPNRELLDRRAAAPNDPRVLVETEIARAGAMDRSRLLVQSTVDPAQVEAATRDDRFIEIGPLIADRAWWSKLRACAIAKIDDFHRASPERAGLNLVDLRQSLRADLNAAAGVFDALIDDLAGDGFIRDGATIRRASHHPELPPRLQAAGERLRAALAERPFDPPSRAQLIGTDSMAQQALKYLVVNHEAVEISAEVVLAADALKRAIELIRGQIQAKGPATVSELKTVLHSSRRIMVPLLEKLDREGVTRRDGDRRVLRDKQAVRGFDHLCTAENPINTKAFMRIRKKYELITTPRVEGQTSTIVRRYAIGVAAVALAGAARVMLGRVFANDVPFMLQLVAVAVAATFGGLGPGLLATCLGGAVGYFLANHGGGADESLIPELRRFLLEASLISALGGWLTVARQRAEASDVARAVLEKQMIEIGDKERRRFGHDLHDGLGQQLTGIALLSESLSHELSTRSLPQAKQAEQIAALVTETIGWTRELARGLSPLTLETDGLTVAIDELVTRANRLFNINCRFDCEHDDLPLAEDSRVHIYRIVQEAISNSVRHGKAKQVRIQAIVDKGQVTITVTDDGSGLSAKTIAQPGIGLRIMQYRANLIGAKLHVARASEKGGTIVSCTLSASASTGNGRQSNSEDRI